MKPFEIIKDVVMGYDHLRLKKNCQDSLSLTETTDFVVGFVADGIGDSIDSPFSEVGSRIVVRLAEEYVTSRIQKTVRWRRKRLLESNVFWMEVQNHLLDKIETFAGLMGSDFKGNILKYFMFTLTGVVLTPDLLIFVGVGDGYFVVNGICEQVAKPSENNMPAALSYNLVESTLRQMSPEEITLSIKKIVKTSEVDSFVVATDGLRSLVVTENGNLVMLSNYCFWNEQKLFDSEFDFGWRLSELASEKRTIDWEEKKLIKQKPVITDDLAVIVGRRV